MAYDKNLFRKLRSAGVDTDGALILATRLNQLNAIADLPGNATLADVIAKVNVILAALRAIEQLKP